MSVQSHTRALLATIFLLAQAAMASAQSGEEESGQPEGVGFQARLHTRSMVVAPYVEPDDRFSVALYPRTIPTLSGQLLYVPKVEERGSFDNNSLSFGMTTHLGFKLIPVSVDAGEYYDRRIQSNIDERWQSFGSNTVTRVQQGSDGEGLSIGVNLPKRFDRMFGEGGANLRVSGYRRITFSGRSQWDDATQSGIRKQSKFPALNMEQISRFSIQGTIGTKISVSVAQDNQTDIPLANRLIIRYKGDDDDILKTLEAGNTNLSIAGTRFVGYSQNISGLFGVKAEAKLGNLSMTVIASQEKGSSESATVSPTGEENAETIRDHAYMEGRIFDLAHHGEIGPNDSVAVWVYEEVNNVSDNSSAEEMYLDNGPRYGNTYDKFPVHMSEVDKQQYELLYGQDTAYCPVALVFYSGHSTRAIGVRMVISRNAATGTTTAVETIGFTDNELTDTVRILQPISVNNKPDNPAWGLMWRNCYRIPKGIEIEDLDVKVYKGLAGREGTSSCLDYQIVDNVSQDPYIRILGLDQRNNNLINSKIPDGKLDPNAEIFRPDWGLLIFPDRQPFNSTRVFEDDNDNVTDTLAIKLRPIYESPNTSTERLENSQYYLQISTKSRSANIRLGRANIIEGSERVLLNGRPLTKGRDYEISYEMGQVTLLTDDATDPNNDIKVEFQYAPFLALQKKTLLGMRAEYERSENLKIGTTVLYKSDKAQERKPRVGQETSQAMVNDVDISFGLNPRFLTSAIDALPFITAEADSRIKVTAEVAQSRPNPNVDGAAYIDDFESAVELQSLGNVRTNWTLSSEPVDVQDSPDEWARGTVRWHNPPAISKEDVYAGETVAGQGALQPLRLIFRPHGYRYTGPTDARCTDSVSSRSWGGIMRYFANRIDENRVQLFEVRAKGGRGVLHFDFGRINEDVDGNGVYEDEDQSYPKNKALDVNNDVNEDTGIDIKLDGEEVSKCGHAVNSDTLPDPASDNFWFEYQGKGAGGNNRPPIPLAVWNQPGFQAEVEDENHWRHYDWVNGTEGNIDDAAVQGIPDREALTGISEEHNAYFTFTLNMDTVFNDYLVPGSGRNGWYTYRVPVRDPGVLDTVAEDNLIVNWSNVSHVRVWFEKDTTGVDSLASMDSIWIADWGFVQSNWADTLLTRDTDDTSQFYVASVSEENGTFSPPPGVEPYVDKVNNVTEAQRGLALVATDLRPGAEGISRKDLLTAESYSGYRRLQMYVHGDPDLDQSDSLMFYFRLGRDSLNYYEYRHFVEAGWSNANHVDIDFNEITGLKDEAEQAAKATKAAVEDSTEIYRVVGRPSINEVLYMSASIKNLGSRTIAGKQEIWLDELRVTDVRKDVGTAARVTVNGSLSDLITYGGTYEHKDAYFRGLAQATRGGSVDNLGSGKESNDLSVNTTLNVSRLLPRSWSARLPVSYTYSQSEAIPLLRNNSDVILPPETREAEKTTSRSIKVSVSESFARKGGGLLFNAFLNRQKVSGSYSRSRQKTVNNPLIFAESYNFKGDFDMGIPKPPELPIFWFAKGLPILKKASASKLALYPRKWMWTASFSRQLSTKDDIDYNRTSSFGRTFDGRMDLTYQVFSTLSFDYNTSTKRDLTDPTLVNLSLRNPKLGLENSYSQGFKLSYDPKLLTFLTGAYAYSATYGDTYDRTTTTRSTSLSASWSIAGEFKHQLLFGRSRKAARPGGPAPAKGTVRGGVRPEDEKEKQTGTPFYEPVLKGMRFLTGWLLPLRYQHTEGFNRSIPGVASRLPWKYRFGLDKMATFPVYGSSRNPSAGESQNWDLGSGFSLLGGITTTVSYKTSITQTLTTVGADRTKSTTTSWPEMSIQIRRFTKLPFIKKYVNWFIDIFSPRTSYSRQVKETENVDRGFIINRGETISRAPLLALNLKVFERLSVTSSYGVTKGSEEKSNSTTGKPETETRNTKKTIAVSSKYSFSAPTGVSIPLLGKLRFKSMVSIDVSVQYTSNLVETSRLKGAFVPFTNSSSFSVSPVISYTFSNKIRGGLTARWQDTNDVLKHRKSHVREIQIWAELHF